MDARGLHGSRAHWAAGLLASAAISVPVHPVQAADSPIGAASADDLDTVNQLISARADVNPQPADGSTALLWAAYNADLEMVKTLLAAGANPMSRTTTASRR